MKRYETTISFSYDAENPADAAMQFIHNIRNAETEWDISVKDIATGKTFTVDTEDQEIYPQGYIKPLK